MIFFGYRRTVQGTGQATFFEKTLKWKDVSVLCLFSLTVLLCRKVFESPRILIWKYSEFSSRSAVLVFFKHSSDRRFQNSINYRDGVFLWKQAAESRKLLCKKYPSLMFDRVLWTIPTLSYSLEVSPVSSITLSWLLNKKRVVLIFKYH